MLQNDKIGPRILLNTWLIRNGSLFSSVMCALSLFERLKAAAQTSFSESGRRVAGWRAVVSGELPKEAPNPPSSLAQPQTCSLQRNRPLQTQHKAPCTFPPGRSLSVFTIVPLSCCNWLSRILKSCCSWSPLKEGRLWWYMPIQRSF